MHSHKNHNKSSIFEDEESSSKSDRKPFKLFSFFRKRIPDENEIAQKESERNKQKQMAQLQDDGDIPPEIIAKQVEKSSIVKPKVEIVDEDDDFEEDIAEQSAPAQKKEGGFMNKLFGFGNKKAEQERDDAQMQMQLQQQNIEDLKETIKILHKWLEKLPSDKIYEFKRSPDFEKYKEGLRKLGLIKE